MGRQADAGDAASKSFLATKVSARNGDEAMRSIEGSLKRLNTDQVDLLHIHNLLGRRDLKAIESAGQRPRTSCARCAIRRWRDSSASPVAH